MYNNFDAAPVTGKTNLHIGTSEAFCKTTLSLPFLKQIGKGKRRATSKWETVFFFFFEIAYCNATEYSSFTDPLTTLSQGTNVFVLLRKG